MKNWKRSIALCLSAVMMVGLLASCGSKNAPAASASGSTASGSTSTNTEDVGDPVKLVFSIAAVPTDAHGAAQKVFKDTLEEISGGNMTVECYDSGSLYGQDTEHDALKNGDVDLIYSSASWLTDGSPWVSMFTAGYVFQSYDHMTKVLNGDIGKEVFQKIADEQGILPLGAYYLGTRQVSLSEDRQIKTPEDLNGVNLRMPNSDAWVFLGKAMGANPTAIPFNDLYLALQTGTVDGQENPLTTFQSYKFYEVVKNVTLTNHIICPNMVFMNGDVWNGLSDHDKEVVQTAINNAIAWQDEQIITAEKSLASELEGLGVTIITPDDTIREATVPYIKPSIEDWDYIQTLA